MERTPTSPTTCRDGRRCGEKSCRGNIGRVELAGVATPGVNYRIPPEMPTTRVDGTYHRGMEIDWNASGARTRARRDVCSIDVVVKNSFHVR